MWRDVKHEGTGAVSNLAFLELCDIKTQQRHLKKVGNACVWSAQTFQSVPGSSTTRQQRSICICVLLISEALSQQHVSFVCWEVVGWIQAGPEGSSVKSCQFFSLDAAETTKLCEQQPLCFQVAPLVRNRPKNDELDTYQVAGRSTWAAVL